MGEEEGSRTSQDSEDCKEIARYQSQTFCQEALRREGHHEKDDKASPGEGCEGKGRRRGQDSGESQSTTSLLGNLLLRHFVGNRAPHDNSKKRSVEAFSVQTSGDLRICNETK